MKNKYKFNYNGELYYIQTLIKKYKKEYNNIKTKYDGQIEKIDNYIDMINLMEEYRKEIIDLLKRIISQYNYFGNNVVIYLTGSFARHTVRPFSDLDLNIVYIKGTGKKYEKYEELFYYLISEVFMYPRRAVHSIITAFNNQENINYVQQHMDEKDIKVILCDNGSTIEYKIPYLSKKRFYLQYMNDKNYKTVFNNLKEIYDNDGIQEWSNNFLFFNQNKLVQKCYDEYISYILSKVNSNNLEEYYEHIISDFDNKIYDFSYIKNIKMVVQMNELHYIYNSVTLLQLIGVLKENAKFFNSFEDIISSGSEKTKNLILNFYEYNYKLIGLNKIFEKYGLDYSIHTNIKIDLSKYPLLEEEIKNITEFMDIMNKKIFNLIKEEVCI